jgi:hypothetical protein
MSKSAKPTPPAFAAVEAAAKPYAAVQSGLELRLVEYKTGLTKLYAEHMPKIRYAVRRLAELRPPLVRALEGAKECFEKPRTVELFGLKLGFRKGKGGLDYEDAEGVIALIQKNFPEKLDQLAPQVRMLDASALEELSAAELKKIGVTLEGSGDQVVIKAALSEADKLVAALLKANPGDDEGSVS